MELTIAECEFLLNAINAQAKTGFADGLAGSQMAMAMAMRLQQHAKTLAAPPVKEKEKPKRREKLPRAAKIPKPTKTANN